MKKYELTNETIEPEGKTLYRIKALRDIGLNITKGTLGGFVESELNLSHEDSCWISDNAMVYGNAVVKDKARVGDITVCRDNAVIHDSAFVIGDSLICDNADVGGHALNYNCIVSGNAKILKKGWVHHANISGNAIINTTVECKAFIVGDVVLENRSDYIFIEAWWCKNAFITWTKGDNKWLVEYFYRDVDKYNTPFYGTGDKLIKEAYEIHDQSTAKEFERFVRYVESTIND